MKRNRLVALLLPLFLLSGCGQQTATEDFFAMNTVMRAQVIGENAQQITQAVQERINTLDQLLSRTQETSEIYQLNQNGQMAASESSAYVKIACEMAQRTQGCYDPTVAVLTDLWGIGTDNAGIPTQTDIEQALTHVGYENVQIAQDGAIHMENGAKIDLGGIAKGMAADECASILQQSGASGLLSLGGNIYAVGQNNGKPWKVGIANPDSPQEYVATVAVTDLSVVTTGDYERYFEQDGKRYHHVFDPTTGYPAETDVRSVSIIGSVSAQCDAYSTALFVMGREKATAFCEENGIAAVFITKDKKIYTTSAVATLCEFAAVEDASGYVYAS